jgi:hypothetical protein
MQTQADRTTLYQGALKIKAAGMTVLIIGIVGALTPAANAAPNSNANCNAILTFLDAQAGTLDDSAHAIKQFTAENNMTPGQFVSWVAHCPAS